jgi:hypothetical protein
MYIISILLYWLIWAQIYQKTEWTHLDIKYTTITDEPIVYKMSHNDVWADGNTEYRELLSGPVGVLNMPNYCMS